MPCSVVGENLDNSARSADDQRGFHELAADDVYTDGAPASPVLVSGRVLPEPGQQQAWIAGS
jgi:hypothetical protein